MHAQITTILHDPSSVSSAYLGRKGCQGHCHHRWDFLVVQCPCCHALVHRRHQNPPRWSGLQECSQQSPGLPCKHLDICADKGKLGKLASASKSTNATHDLVLSRAQLASRRLVLVHVPTGKQNSAGNLRLSLPAPAVFSREMGASESESCPESPAPTESAFDVMPIHTWMKGSQRRPRLWAGRTDVSLKQMIQQVVRSAHNS